MLMYVSPFMFVMIPIFLFCLKYYLGCKKDKDKQAIMKRKSEDGYYA